VGVEEVERNDVVAGSLRRCLKSMLATRSWKG